MAVGLLVLYNRPTYWVGIWPETGAAVAVSAFFMSLFVAGSSAWAAARLELMDVRALAAARTNRRLFVEGNLWAAALFWLTAPLLAVAALAAATTAASGVQAGFPSFVGYGILGLLLVWLAGAWGWIVGRLLEPLVAALAAALSWFIIGSLAGEITGATPVSGPPWIALQASALVLRSSAALLLIVTIVALTGRSEDQRSRLKGAAFVAVAALVVAASHVALPVQQPRSPVASPLCVNGHIEYCLWPEHEKYVPLIRQVDAEVGAVPLDLPLPPKIVDYSLSGSTQWIDGNQVELPGEYAPEFDISEGSRWALARGVAKAITRSVLSTCERSAAIEDPAHHWDLLLAWLEVRLAGGGSPDYTTNAPANIQAAWFEARRVSVELNDAQQAAWAVSVIDGHQKYCSGA